MIRKFEAVTTNLWFRIFLLFIIVVISAMILWYILTYVYRPLYNLPEYPNATQTNSYSSDALKQLNIHCGQQVFYPKKYQVLLTTDPNYKIPAFYGSLQALSRHLGGSRLNGDPPTVCYTAQYSTVAITTLDPSDQYDAKFIKELFPQNIPIENIIIAEVGYVEVGL